jgi:hypothetical protein
MVATQMGTIVLVVDYDPFVESAVLIGYNEAIITTDGYVDHD